MAKAKGLRKPVTPNSQIRAALRQLWLRSRERGQAVKDQRNTCQTCGRKGSVAKGREVRINVHHRKGVNWDGLLQLIRERLLQTPDDYECMCEECHVKLHKEEKDEQE
jgi:predicted HNH restriction endonuclease